MVTRSLQWIEAVGAETNSRTTDLLLPFMESASENTRKIGEELYRSGYRGYFDVDYLIDMENQAVYLGELNPRISGATPLTTNAAMARGGMPLFMLHLFEFFDTPYEPDIEAFNSEWAQQSEKDCWSSLIIKYQDSSIDRVRTAPRSGIWTMRSDGAIEYDRFACDCKAVRTNQEAFVQRVAAPGEYRFPGEDIARVLLRERVLTSDYSMTARADGMGARPAGLLSGSRGR